MAIEVRTLSVRESWAALSSLWDEHWSECETSFSSTPPAPQREVYEAMEAQGRLVSIGAYASGELVGYAAAIIGPHPRYGWTFAELEVLFLQPAHRRGNDGRLLLDELWHRCLYFGAETMLIGARPASALDAICLRAGWATDQVVYRRV